LVDSIIVNVLATKKLNQKELDSALKGNIRGINISINNTSAANLSALIIVNNKKSSLKDLIGINTKYLKSIRVIEPKTAVSSYGLEGIRGVISLKIRKRGFIKKNHNQHSY
jgi:flagellar assembly factor FliW